MKAAVPEHEAARLAALDRLGLLDTPPEERFDRLTRITRRTFDVPFAFITLVDAQRQWNKSRQGAPTAAVPRDVSFCAHAILGDGPLVIPDATQDPRFAENPGVAGKPGIKFYAGQPLHSPDGYNLGTLCILDRRPATSAPTIAPRWRTWRRLSRPSSPMICSARHDRPSERYAPSSRIPHWCSSR